MKTWEVPVVIRHQINYHIVAADATEAARIAEQLFASHARPCARREHECETLESILAPKEIA
jgi:hypothetical protein